MDEALQTARSCRHYAMCKIDYLGSGVCASGVAKHYVSYYPQGRMDLYAALAQHKVPVTDACVAIADSCDLCGKCDYQCCFVTEMRPSAVMKALKEHVARHLATGGTVEQPVEDPLLLEIRAIVGAEWASNDRAIAVTYASDPCALAVAKMPDYVVLPRTREEIAALLKLFRQHDVPWVVRANGTNVLGFHLCEGAVIDLNRMKDIAFDEKNWAVRIGPGVAAFDLQREAVRRGFRVNVAEPAALVCGSTMCSGILSLFSAAYGTSADNFIDAEFVALDGSHFSLNEKEAPNLFAFKKTGHETPGICTSLTVKLQPMTDDEEGVLVPFRTLAEALDFARGCSVRRIGLAIGVLGAEYVSAFIAPTRQLAADAREVFESRLGMACMVLVIGDKYALHSIAEMGHPFIDQRLFTALSLGLPALRSAPWLDLVTELTEDEPFSYLKIEGFTELAETALAPSPARLAQETAPELRGFYEQLYARPELTNLVWLNMFRITSTRIGREKHFFPLLMYLPLEYSLISALNDGFTRIGERHRLKHEFGFVTPVDGGKRCIYEYDYFYDQNDPNDIARVQLATQEAGELIEEHSAREGTIRWLKYLLYQGYCRKENLLYA
ncbi:MAG TPA: FAD-binding protein [Geobacteraceae bacterium]|nr:FAD-binding protein [Geobacteraceae bacterium]